MGAVPSMEEMHPWPLPFPAARGPRLLSLGVDLALLAAAGFVFALLEGLWFAEIYAGSSFLGVLLHHGRALLGGVILWAAALGLFAWVYFVVLRAACGRTCGESIWGLRLIRHDGQTPGLWDCIQRGVVAALSLLPLGAGYWWSFLNRQGKTWPDHLSGTLIVENWPHFCP